RRWDAFAVELRPLRRRGIWPYRSAAADQPHVIEKRATECSLKEVVEQHPGASRHPEIGFVHGGAAVIAHDHSTCIRQGREAVVCAAMNLGAIGVKQVGEPSGHGCRRDGRVYGVDCKGLVWDVAECKRAHLRRIGGYVKRAFGIGEYFVDRTFE